MARCVGGCQWTLLPTPRSAHRISPDWKALLTSDGTVLDPAQLPSPNSAENSRFYGIFYELSFPASRKNSKHIAEVQLVTSDLFSEFCGDRKLLSLTQTARFPPHPQVCASSVYFWI